jgi:Uma2 family endonuclease
MSVAMKDLPRRHGIKVDEYHRMAEAGLLAPDARVELIEGEIIEMPPIGNAHAAAVDRLADLLHSAVGKRAIVRCQGPIQLGDDSEPQPDLALLVRREDFYKDQRPAAADTILVIEVSDTTAHYDLTTKMSLYAQYGIREYWVIDLRRKQVRTYRCPTGTAYEEMSALETPGETSMLGLPGVSVDLSALFD